MTIMAHAPSTANTPCVTPDALNCPPWCPGGHGVEHDFGVTWVDHNATVEEPIEGTDRSAVVWIEALNDSAPRLVIAHDREDADGEVRRYEGMPPEGLEPAEAAALSAAIAKAMAAITDVKAATQ